MRDRLGLLLMAITLIFWACSCNPTKRVLQSKDLTEKVVREYVRQNPPKNDTTFIRGKDSIITRVELDTIPLPYPVKERYVERHFVEKSRVDTSKIKDRELLKALNNRLTKLENDYAELKADRDYWRQQARVRLYALILLLVIAIAAAVGWLWLKFQPRIRIEK